MESEKLRAVKDSQSVERSAGVDCLADLAGGSGPTVHTHLHTVQGGGTRSEKAPPYHLVPRAGTRRTALRFGLGADKHGPWNWTKSVQTEQDAAAWAIEAYNHMVEHTYKMVNCVEPDDDHLGAIGWAQSILCYIEEKYNKPWTELAGVWRIPNGPEETVKPPSTP